MITSSFPAPAALITAVPARRHGRGMARDCVQHYLSGPRYITLSQPVIRSFQTQRYDEHSYVAMAAAAVQAQPCGIVASAAKFFGISPFQMKVGRLD